MSSDSDRFFRRDSRESGVYDAADMNEMRAGGGGGEVSTGAVGPTKWNSINPAEALHVPPMSGEGFNL